jgi:hypothetical protein
MFNSYSCLLYVVWKEEQTEYVEYERNFQLSELDPIINSLIVH